MFSQGNKTPFGLDPRDDWGLGRTGSRSSTSRMAPPVLTFVVLGALAFLAWAFWPATDEPPDGAQAIVQVSDTPITADGPSPHSDALGLLQNGRYDEILRLKGSDELEETAAALVDTDLETRVRFRFLPDQRPTIVEAAGREGVTLTPSDPYFFEVRPSDRCYLYVVQIGGNGAVRILFPNARVGVTNPVPPMTFRLPDRPSWYYPLEGGDGIQEIFFVAIRWRDALLEDLAKRTKEDVPVTMEAGTLADLRTRLARMDRYTDEIPGMSYGRQTFLQASRVSLD